MSGMDYWARTDRVFVDDDGNTVTEGEFTFYGRQDRHLLDEFERITGVPVKARQFKSGQTVRYRRVDPPKPAPLSAELLPQEV